MPVVLMQRAWKDDPKYKDTEFVVYHYPQQYFDRIRGGTVLAFGKMPRSEVAWIANILQENDVAFVACEGDSLKPMNDLAKGLPVFQ